MKFLVSILRFEISNISGWKISIRKLRCGKKCGGTAAISRSLKKRGKCCSYRRIRLVRVDSHLTWIKWKTIAFFWSILFAWSHPNIPNVELSRFERNQLGCREKISRCGECGVGKFGPSKWRCTRNYQENAESSGGHLTAYSRTLGSPFRSGLS